MYLVDPKDAAAEKEWLRELKVYPSEEAYYDFIHLVQYARFGMIVTPEAASLIKMRHPLQFQMTYQGR